MKLTPKFRNKKRVLISQNRCFGFKKSRDLISTFSSCRIDKNWQPFREGTFLIKEGGGGGGRVILEIFSEKSRGPRTSQIGLMHDPSQIPKQKQPSTSSRT